MFGSWKTTGDSIDYNILGSLLLPNAFPYNCSMHSVTDDTTFGINCLCYRNSQVAASTLSVISEGAGKITFQVFI